MGGCAGTTHCGARALWYLSVTLGSVTVELRLEDFRTLEIVLVRLVRVNRLRSGHTGMSPRSGNAACGHQRLTLHVVLRPRRPTVRNATSLVARVMGTAGGQARAVAEGWRLEGWHPLQPGALRAAPRGRGGPSLSVSVSVSDSGSYARGGGWVGCVHACAISKPPTASTAHALPSQQNTRKDVRGESFPTLRATRPTNTEKRSLIRTQTVTVARCPGPSRNHSRKR